MDPALEIGDEQAVSKNRRRKLAAKARKLANKDRTLSDEFVDNVITSPLSNSVLQDSTMEDKMINMASSLPVDMSPGISFGSLPNHHKKTKSKSKLKRQKSDPIRLMSPLKNKCQHEEKIAKALENREQLLQEKSEKVRLQNKKVVDVLHSKAVAIQQIRDNLSDKMQRAERKREMQLTTIKSKARDEAVKVDEINFINNMKSQDRIRDVLEKEQKMVSRQQFLEEERAKRSEENKARDAAVEDRRRQQEQERAAKISEMEERKRLKVKKVEQNVNERLQLVRDKARDRAMKLSAIETAQQENLRSLKEKIQKKVEVSSRLHEERMELKRLRAQFLRSPRPGSADSSCHNHDSLIFSRCRSHTGDVSPRKEKGNDIKQKIDEQVANNYLTARYEKIKNNLCKKLSKQAAQMEKPVREARMESGDVSVALDILESLKFATSWASWNPQITASMDACLERLGRHLNVARAKDKKTAADLQNGILEILVLSISAISSSTRTETSSTVPDKPICAIYELVSVFLSCDTFSFLLNTDIFVKIVEQAKYFLENLVFNINSAVKIKISDAVLSSCFKALENIFDHFNRVCSQIIPEEISERLGDFVRYFLTCGIIHMIGRYRTMHDHDGRLRHMQKCFQFTTWISRLASSRKVASDRGLATSETEKDELESAVHSELCIYRDILKTAPVFSSVTLLYDLLRLGRSRPRCFDSCETELPEESYRIAVDIVKMLNCIGNADLIPLQMAFRDLTLSIQFRHICSFLISHCLTFHEERAYLLHDIVLLIGQFAFLSAEHQDMVHAGHLPNLLQQLARFPVEYLTVSALQDILLPTIVICCYQNKKNRTILAEEMDLNHLTVYIKDKELNGNRNKDMERHLRLALSCTQRYRNVFREHSEEDFVRYALENRFPRSLWNAAANFFYVSSVEENEDKTL